MHLRADHPYSIGRRPRQCELVFLDWRISKRHCQVLFDASLRKLYILNNVLLHTHHDSTASTCRLLVHEFRKKAMMSFHGNDGALRKASNGVFVNGFEIQKGKAVELSVGDRVLLVCGNENGSCGIRNRIGFVVERIDFEGCGDEIDSPDIRRVGRGIKGFLL